MSYNPVSTAPVIPENSDQFLTEIPANTFNNPPQSYNNSFVASPPIKRDSSDSFNTSSMTSSSNSLLTSPAVRPSPSFGSTTSHLRTGPSHPVSSVPYSHPIQPSKIITSPRNGSPGLASPTQLGSPLTGFRPRSTTNGSESGIRPRSASGSKRPIKTNMKFSPVFRRKSEASHNQNDDSIGEVAGPSALNESSEPDFVRGVKHPENHTIKEGKTVSSGWMSSSSDDDSDDPRELGKNKNRNVRTKSWVDFSDEEDAEDEMFNNTNYSYPLGNNNGHVQPHLPEPISFAPYNPSDETPMLSPLIDVSAKMKRESITPPANITPTEQQHPIVEPPMVTPENKVSKPVHSIQPEQKNQHLSQQQQQQQQFVSPVSASPSSSNYVDDAENESTTDDGQFSYMASEASPRESTNPYSSTYLASEPLSAPVKPVSSSANHSETDLATLGAATPTGSTVDVTAIDHDEGNVTAVSHSGVNDTTTTAVEDKVNDNALAGSPVNLVNFGPFESTSRKPRPELPEVDEREAILRVDTSTTTKDHYDGFDGAGSGDDNVEEDSEFPTPVVTSTTPVSPARGVKSGGRDEIPRQPRQPSIAELDESVTVLNAVVSEPAISTTSKPTERSVTPVVEEKEQEVAVPLVKDADTVKPVHNVASTDSEPIPEQVPVPNASVSVDTHPAFDNTAVERSWLHEAVTDDSVKEAVAPSISRKPVDTGDASNTSDVSPALIGSAGVASGVLAAAVVSAANEAETGPSSVIEKPVAVESAPSNVESDVERPVTASDHEEKLISTLTAIAKAKTSDSGSSAVKNATSNNIEPAIGKPTAISATPDRVESTGGFAGVDKKVPPTEWLSKSVSPEVPLAKSVSSVDPLSKSVSLVDPLSKSVSQDLLLSKSVSQFPRSSVTSLPHSSGNLITPTAISFSSRQGSVASGSPSRKSISSTPGPITTASLYQNSAEYHDYIYRTNVRKSLTVEQRAQIADKYKLPSDSDSDSGVEEGEEEEDHDNSDVENQKAAVLDNSKKTEQIGGASTTATKSADVAPSVGAHKKVDDVQTTSRDVLSKQPSNTNATAAASEINIFEKVHSRKSSQVHSIADSEVSNPGHSSFIAETRKKLGGSSVPRAKSPISVGSAELSSNSILDRHNYQEVSASLNHSLKSATSSNFHIPNKPSGSGSSILSSHSKNMSIRGTQTPPKPFAVDKRDSFDFEFQVPPSESIGSTKTSKSIDPTAQLHAPSSSVKPEGAGVSNVEKAVDSSEKKNAKDHLTSSSGLSLASESSVTAPRVSAAQLFRHARASSLGIASDITVGHSPVVAKAPTMATPPLPEARSEFTATPFKDDDDLFESFHTDPHMSLPAELKVSRVVSRNEDLIRARSDEYVTVEQLQRRPSLEFIRGSKPQLSQISDSDKPSVSSTSDLVHDTSKPDVLDTSLGVDKTGMTPLIENGAFVFDEGSLNVNFDLDAASTDKDAPASDDQIGSSKHVKIEAPALHETDLVDISVAGPHKSLAPPHSQHDSQNGISTASDTVPASNDIEHPTLKAIEEDAGSDADSERPLPPLPSIKAEETPALAKKKSATSVATQNRFTHP
ncbi:unnamed protein product [Ambrosiozyma monospora]|uniref:Unnamed protein product n=1 Tax=Ambrosiozyma monospora TaxID=43982 RepID=A0ACB5SV42_AMBMO|nr:unnamed protein product [Ambrosiozyma monospora]